VDAAFFGEVPAAVDPAADGPTRLRYPWAEQLEALEAAAAETPSPLTSLEYRGGDGGPVMPTMGAWAHVVEADSVADRPARTSSSVFVVVDGALTLVAGEDRHELEVHDVFVVQPWTRVRFETRSERTHLFSFGDEPVLRSLGLYREEPGAVRQR
jgi:gentisate 1,2-dioxygenase